MGKCGGEGWQEAAIKKTKIKSGKQTERATGRSSWEWQGWRQQHPEDAQLLQTGGLDFSDLNAVLTSCCCSVILLPLPTCMVATAERLTRLPERTAQIAQTGEETRKNNISAEPQWESNLTTQLWPVPASMPRLPTWAESHPDSLQTHHALNVPPLWPREAGCTHLIRSPTAPCFPAHPSHTHHSMFKPSYLSILIRLVKDVLHFKCYTLM